MTIRGWLGSSFWRSRIMKRLRTPSVLLRPLPKKAPDIYLIHHFHCDNGHAKYNNQYFTDSLAWVGISYDHSLPYTQNQNGVSEWKIWTIVKKARTMLLESKLPECFCAEAVSTAVYVTNRSLTKAITGKTLFEAWSGRRPELSHLRRFGCDAYLYVPDAQRMKLRLKARFCTFPGYVLSTTK